MKHILILEDEQRNANRLVRLLKEIVPEARICGSGKRQVEYYCPMGLIPLISSNGESFFRTS